MRSRHVIALFPVLLLATAVQAAPQGYAPLPPPSNSLPLVPTPQLLLPLLRDIPDAAGADGMLVVLASPTTTPITEPLPNRITSLRFIARALGKQVITAGGVSTLAPLTMPVIEAHPPAANIYAGLRPGEALKALLATFTPAQWQQIGSAYGIGPRDLAGEQVRLWERLMPTHLQLREEKAELVSGVWQPKESTQTSIQNMSAIRLRLNKTVEFELAMGNSTNYSYSGNPYGTYNRTGPVSYSMSRYDDSAVSPAANTAFGVALVPDRRARLKVGAVDFTASALNVVVPLARLSAGTDGTEAPTIGDLLRQITKTTGVEFVADRRVRDLPIYVRGDARAGDLLMALAWSVSGVFRKIEPATVGGDTAPLYLLTDDIEGIGTRVARLADWGEEAAARRQKFMEGTASAAAKSHPLQYLSFAREDRFALSDTLSEHIEDVLLATRDAEAPVVAMDALPPALQEMFLKYAADSRSKVNRIRIGEALGAYLIVPEAGGVAVRDDWLSGELTRQYLQELAQSPPAPAPKPVPPLPAPDMKAGFQQPWLAGQRRILIVRPPADDTEAVAPVMQEAARRGFTDVWVEVGLSDPAASGRLLEKTTLAAAAARKSGARRITVAGVVRLLKNSGVSGETEHNLLGETGDEFAVRHDSPTAPPSDRYTYDGYRGWVVPDQADLQKRLAELVAAAPDLALLALRDGSAPGWIGTGNPSARVLPLGGLGYTPSVRRQFLRARGIDPIDIPDPVNAFQNMMWDIGFFREHTGGDPNNTSDYNVVDGMQVLRSASEIPRLAWQEFLKKQNDALLADIFRSVHKSRPSLPLYIDDRTSGYTHSWAWNDYFGSWDAADRLPQNGVAVFGQPAWTTARAVSKKVFFHWRRWWLAHPNNKEEFAQGVVIAALSSPPGLWDGVVIDLAEDIPTADLLGLLQALPAIPPGK